MITSKDWSISETIHLRSTRTTNDVKDLIVAKYNPGITAMTLLSSRNTGVNNLNVERTIIF